MTTIAKKLTFVRIGAPEDFPAGYGQEVRVGGSSYAVFHTTDDRFFALENRTPHPKGGTLAEAIVSGHYIYCPIRDTKICLETGVVQAPDNGQAQAFEIRTEAGGVHIGLPLNAI